MRSRAWETKPALPAHESASSLSTTDDDPKSEKVLFCVVSLRLYAVYLLLCTSGAACRALWCPRTTLNDAFECCDASAASGSGLRSVPHYLRVPIFQFHSFLLSFFLLLSYCLCGFFFSGLGASPGCFCMLHSIYAALPWSSSGNRLRLIMSYDLGNHYRIHAYTRTHTHLIERKGKGSQVFLLPQSSVHLNRCPAYCLCCVHGLLIGRSLFRSVS